MANIQEKLLEEKLIRCIRAKRRFRAAIRHVIHNLYWLQETLNDFALTSNIKTTISRLVTTKDQKDKILKIKEISILRRFADYRTPEEQAHLFKVIGNLKCFQNYPENVRKQLVEVTYYEYFGPGRILVREQQEPYALYFLLRGEATITRHVYDEITQKWEDIEIAKITSGKMFGEIALLHNIPRTATVTAISHCELLVLRRTDFDRVLKITLMATWDEIRKAMAKFPYFKKWDNLSLQECCRLSKIKHYQPNKVILGDGVTKNKQKLTYFIIEGKCSVIQHLLVETITSKYGKKSYKLLKEPETRDVFHKIESQMGNVNYDADIRHTESQIRESAQYVFFKDEEESISYTCSYEQMIHDDDEDEESQISLSEELQTNAFRLARRSPSTVKMLQCDEISMECKKIIAETKFYTQRPTKIFYSKLGDHFRCQDIKFIEICTFVENALFSDCALFNNKRIVTILPTKCLLVPTYILTANNKGNVWTRLNNYIESRFPSVEELFEIYVNEKKRKEYKEKLVKSTMKYQCTNTATKNDVPYSIRVFDKKR